MAIARVARQGRGISSGRSRNRIPCFLFYFILLLGDRILHITLVSYFYRHVGSVGSTSHIPFCKLIHSGPHDLETSVPFTPFRL
ncbi:hypothetical protein BC936DRAFT_140847 [Jimgerdemannia flammicorona]|uniref:Uncharacterized protein n=2 Tax=Jimgerdemannia flammicorona TaxID=994334 RepID=A0A433A3A9_9FUNG|nr:hypothetical protein BC936DRAFT_140847 [Jimgerdemannia flammicorona]RUS28998.1 hypothetical protein BC938DRAFT_481184 [Jimgerdemannia flammicorona]